MTGTAIVTRALKTIGAIGVGETPSASDTQDALSVLNGMLSQWRASRLTVTHTTRNPFTATNGVARYTLGPGGDWDYPTVPTWIDHASVIIPGGTPYEQRLSILTTQRFDEFAIKDQSFAPLAWIYYERKAPLGVVQVWPVPNNTQTVYLYLLEPLSGFALPTTDVDLPSGFEDAMVYNLAKRLCLEFSKQVDPLLMEMASTSLNLIQSSNLDPSELVCDPAVRQRRWPYGTSLSAFLGGYFGNRV